MPASDPLTGETFEAEKQALVDAYAAEKHTEDEVDRLRRALDQAATERNEAELNRARREGQLRDKIRRAISHGAQD